LLDQTFICAGARISRLIDAAMTLTTTTLTTTAIPTTPAIPTATIAAIAWLDLLQWADSALPIGGQSHSYGLETLIADGLVTVDTFAAWLHDYVGEVGGQEACFCAGAYALGAAWHTSSQAQAEWPALNRRLSALRPARESRAASAALGRRFLALAADVSGHTALADALTMTRTLAIDCHHVAAFGLTGGVLGLDRAATCAAYLHQTVLGLLTACQKLLPIGQSELARLRRRLQPAMAAAVLAAAAGDWRAAPPCCAFHVEVASMRHPGLAVRLFIS
jgi:urease accessory protein